MSPQGGTLKKILKRFKDSLNCNGVIRHFETILRSHIDIFTLILLKFLSYYQNIYIYMYTSNAAENYKAAPIFLPVHTGCNNIRHERPQSVGNAKVSAYPQSLSVHLD